MLKYIRCTLQQILKTSNPKLYIYDLSDQIPHMLLPKMCNETFKI